MKLEQANKMTMQEAMDYSVKKIVEQGGKCMDGGNCAYGNNEGKHCAVGWLLDEDNEDLMRSGLSLSVLVAEQKEHIPDVIKQNAAAFSWLQSFHDSAPHLALYYLTKHHGIDTSAPHWEQWVHEQDPVLKTM